MARIDLEPLPHREAIEYMRSKGYAHELQRFHHLDHFREDHARNWVVAKAVQDDVTRAIRQEFETAFSEGRTLDQFRADLAPRLMAMGWWGKAEMEDSVTGQMEEVRLGSMHRLRTIFDTNMRTAHAAGHWAAIQRTKTSFPYLHYIQIQRRTKRHDHARFHDKIWRVDDPIWLKIYPPNGYFCGCIVIQRTEGWMRRNARTPDEALPLEEEEWTNKRSGETQMIPRGVQPGFDTNPGALWLDIKDNWENMTPDLTPGARMSELGLIEGLRLRRLNDGRESLIITDAQSRPVSMQHAAPDRPSMVSLDGLELPLTPSFLHSHATDASLSADDLDVLFTSRGHAITAVTPGGSLWRATRTHNTDLRPLMGEMGLLISDFTAELRANENAAEIFMHARLLWLEKKGVITYHWSMSERVRQIMDGNADLIQRLSDVYPAR